MPVHREDGSLALDREEYPRPQTTLEGLAGLKPAFTAVADYPLDDKGTTYRNLILQKYPDLEIEFVHHAGNSSGVVDGSAAILLASPNYAKAHGLKPRARVVAMANMGDSPDPDAQCSGTGRAQGAGESGPDARRYRSVRDQRGIRGGRGEIHP